MKTTSPPTTRIGPVAMPNISRLFVMLAVLGAGVIVLQLSLFKLSSLDTGYHLAYGRHFLATGEIVGRDPFIEPDLAIPFVNANWGSQVAMAWVERMCGARGLIGLRVALIGAVFFSVARFARMLGGGWLAVSLAVLLAAAASYERFSLRPELFSYALMGGTILLLLSRVGTRRALALLAAAQVAWVNLHSYFLVGPLMTGACLVGAIFRGGKMESATRPRGALGAALVVQLLACMVNPWGVEGALFPIRTLSFLRESGVMASSATEAGQSAWSIISEFHAPHTDIGRAEGAHTLRAYYLLMGLGVVAAVLLVRRRRFDLLGLILLFGLMSTQMRRNIAQFAMIGSPIFVAAIGEALRGRIAATGGAARLVGGCLAIVTCAVWSWGLVDGRFYYAERRIVREPGFDYGDRFFPRRAALWMASRPELRPGLFVDYFTSSNALPWLPERFKLYCDTNTFAVSDATLGTAFDVGLGRKAHAELFDGRGINVVLLHCGPDTLPLVRALRADYTEWGLVYVDAYHVIFIRRIVEHVPVLRECHPEEGTTARETWLAGLPERSGYRALGLAAVVSTPISLGWHRSAISVLEELARVAPGDFEAWNNLGLCHAELSNEAIRARDRVAIVRELELAHRCFQEAIRIRPDDPVAKRNLELLRRNLPGEH